MYVLSLQKSLFEFVSLRTTLTSSRLRWTCARLGNGWRRESTRLDGRYVNQIIAPQENYIIFCVVVVASHIISRLVSVCCLSRRLQFCNDMYLMMDNAWLFNRRTSKVYKFCTKLMEVFESSINEPMQRLGYCCGRRVSSC